MRANFTPLSRGRSLHLRTRAPGEFGARGAAERHRSQTIQQTAKLNVREVERTRNVFAALQFFVQRGIVD